MSHQEDAEALRQIKIPEQMKQSQALIDYIAAKADNLEQPGQPPMSPVQGVQELGRIVALMLGSQLEVIAVVGNMTENLKGLSNIGEILKNLIRPQQQ